MEQKKLYLVAYDIASPKRLRRALHEVRNFATGGQKSVFECFLSHVDFHELKLICHELIDPDEDRIAILQVENRAAIKTLGIGEIPEDQDYFYIG